MSQEPPMNDNYEEDGDNQHGHSTSNETDYFNEETTGALWENSAWNMTKPTRHSFVRYKIKCYRCIERSWSNKTKANWKRTEWIVMLSVKN